MFIVADSNIAYKYTFSVSLSGESEGGENREIPTAQC